jgi:hypothetical protein
MWRQLARDLGITAILCVLERMLERVTLPGLHRLPGRIAAVDPSRVEDFSTLLGEALALFALVWIFGASLYAISIVSRRPLRPYAVTLVAGAILVLTYAASVTEFVTQR